PPDITIHIDTFHHNPVAALAVCIVIFQLCLAILPCLHIRVPVNGCTDIINRAPLGGIVFRRVELAFFHVPQGCQVYDVALWQQTLYLAERHTRRFFYFFGIDGYHAVILVHTAHGTQLITEENLDALYFRGHDAVQRRNIHSHPVH